MEVREDGEEEDESTTRNAIVGSASRRKAPTAASFLPIVRAYGSVWQERWVLAGEAENVNFDNHQARSSSQLNTARVCRHSCKGGDPTDCRVRGSREACVERPGRTMFQGESRHFIKALQLRSRGTPTPVLEKYGQSSVARLVNRLEKLTDFNDAPCDIVLAPGHG